MNAHLEIEKKHLRRNYVLDRLPEDEKYQYEENCFDDEIEMARLEEERDEVIDDYLTSNLSPDEKRSFENYFLNSPANLRDVALAKANRKLINEKSVADFDAEVCLTAVAPTLWERVFKKHAGSAGTRGVKQVSWWHLTPVKFNIGYRSMAPVAVMLLVAVGSYLWFRSFTPLPISKEPSDLVAGDSRLNNLNAYNQLPVPAPTENTESIQQRNTNQNVRSGKKSLTAPANKPRTNKPSDTVIAFVLIPNIRSSEEAKPLVISKSTASVELLITRPPTDYRDFRVVVSTVEGQEVWSRKFRVKNNDQHKQHIKVTVPSKTFNNQDYILDLSGVNLAGESESVGKYSFRVVRNK